jgi:putative peptide zinc metalloprotease protein
MTIQPTALLELYPGVQIVAFDNSTREKTYRVELSTGVHFQINEKLYHILDSLRMPMTLVNLAAAFQQRTGQPVTLDQLEQLSEQLTEQGIITQAMPGERPTLQPTKPPQKTGAYLGLHYRRDLFSAETLAPLARALRFFFTWPMAIILMTFVAVVHLFAYQQIGVSFIPELAQLNLPLLAGILLASIAIHELGHLAACHRWQCPHGPLGFGLYFFSPVFYVDVTAAWRLSRKQRAVVDSGGMYLQLLCVPLFWLGFLLTHATTYLAAIQMIDIMILLNFTPLMKLDGYWLLSDLTGVPNLHTRTGEAILQMTRWVLSSVGWRNAQPQSFSFSQWPSKVRWVMFGYIALSIIMWPFEIILMGQMLIAALVTYPALWQAAFVSLGQAARTHDLVLLLTQFKVLFLPTLILVETGFLLKITWDRWHKARTAKAHQASTPTPLVQPV